MANKCLVCGLRHQENVRCATALLSTPALDKMAEVQPLSQAIGEFLAWLSEQRLFIARHHEHQEGGCVEGCSRTVAEMVMEDSESMLARYFEIDLEAVEREKRALHDGQVVCWKRGFYEDDNKGDGKDGRV